MIKLCFGPGCYGHYLAQCLWHFTDIGDGVDDFDFDINGSSHIFQRNLDAQKHIKCGHFSRETSTKYHPATLSVSPGDRCITILPVQGHWLDYYNNQYIKYYKSDTLACIYDQVSSDEINKKLQQNWQYFEGPTSDIPRWIIRELISFYLYDILRSGYAQDPCNLQESIRVSTTMFFDNFIVDFQNLCRELGITVTASRDTLFANNTRFKQVQKYHDSQRRCQNWASDILQSRYSPSPAQTLYDEAYIQHLLREEGFEIRCDGLDEFPISSDALRSLIYQK